jgi:hypothetical protein
VKRERRLDALRADGNDDGVARVVPAREARADIDVGGEYVYELAFTLVSPLRSKYGRHFTDCVPIGC